MPRISTVTCTGRRYVPTRAFTLESFIQPVPRINCFLECIRTHQTINLNKVSTAGFCIFSVPEQGSRSENSAQEMDPPGYSLWYSTGIKIPVRYLLVPVTTYFTTYRYAYGIFQLQIVSWNTILDGKIISTITNISTESRNKKLTTLRYYGRYGRYLLIPRYGRYLPTEFV